MPLGDPGGAARIQDVEHIFGAHLLRFAVRRRVLHEAVPPVVAPLRHLGVALAAIAGALHHYHVLDRRRLLERLIGVALERQHRAAPVAAVGGDEHFALRIVDPVAQTVAREAAEHHRVRRADARAREHRDHDLGDERQVDRHAIAALHAQRVEHVRELVHLAVQVPVCERPRIARLALPHERRLVATRAAHMAVETIHARVQRAAGEPLRPRRIPLEHSAPGLRPLELMRHLRPERFVVLRGALVHCGGIDVRPFREIRGRREFPVLVEEDVDIVRHGTHSRCATGPSPDS